MNYQIELIDPYDIRATEHHMPEKIPALKDKILKEQSWSVPVVVEKYSYILMDGHHRLETAKSLGLKYIPAVLLDYTEVRVESRRPEINITPDDIIRRGLTGDIYPAKTTRHIFPYDFKCFLALDDLGLASKAA